MGRPPRPSGLRAVTRPYGRLRRVKTDRRSSTTCPRRSRSSSCCSAPRTTEQASLFQVAEAKVIYKDKYAEEIEQRGNVLAAMTKLKQVCNHPAQLLRGRPPVGRSIREGDPGSRRSWTRSLGSGYIYADGHPVHRVRRAAGAAPGRELRPRRRPTCTVAPRRSGATRWWARFQSGDGPPILLLSLKAGGAGLNLTAAECVLCTWTGGGTRRWRTRPADRAFRIGQRRSVQVREFICTSRHSRRESTR